MGVYFKWSAIIIIPFLVLAAAFFCFLRWTEGRERLGEQEVDQSFNQRHIERMQQGRLEKLRQDAERRRREAE